MPRLRIPTALRPFTGGAAEVEVAGATVREAVADLERQHPGLGGRILGEGGELRRFVNLYRGDTDVRDLGGLDTALDAGDVLLIVPAIAGG